MHFLTQILDFCRCINVNWTKLSEHDNCLICSMCFTWFTGLIEEYSVSYIHEFTFCSQTQYITWEMASLKRSRHIINEHAVKILKSVLPFCQSEAYLYLFLIKMLLFKIYSKYICRKTMKRKNTLLSKPDLRIRTNAQSDFTRSKNIK